jgi:hypothetical protein
MLDSPVICVSTSARLLACITQIRNQLCGTIAFTCFTKRTSTWRLDYQRSDEALCHHVHVSSDLISASAVCPWPDVETEF